SESTEERNSNAITIPLQYRRSRKIGARSSLLVIAQCPDTAIFRPVFLVHDGAPSPRRGADAFSVADTGPAMARRGRLGRPDRGFGHPRGLTIRWELGSSQVIGRCCPAPPKWRLDLALAGHVSAAIATPTPLRRDVGGSSWRGPIRGVE